MTSMPTSKVGVRCGVWAEGRGARRAGTKSRSAATQEILLRPDPHLDARARDLHLDLAILVLEIGSASRT